MEQIISEKTRQKYTRAILVFMRDLQNTLVQTFSLQISLNTIYFCNFSENFPTGGKDKFRNGEMSKDRHEPQVCQAHRTETN